MTIFPKGRVGSTRWGWRARRKPGWGVPGSGTAHWRPSSAPFSGNPLPLHRFEPARSPTIRLKGVPSRMNRGTSAERALLRQAFDLLLELRSRPEARKLLGQAVSYLRLLDHQGEPGGLPLVISVQVMRLGKF